MNVEAASTIGKEAAGVVRVLLTTKEAAAALAVSDRTLWSLTAPRGPIASVRIGTAVRYRPADLEAWAAAQASVPAGGKGRAARTEKV
jgi:excisionase family DNA binding protein